MSDYLCAHCNQTKPIGEFYAYSKRKCKACWKRYNTEWAKKHPEARAAMQRRRCAKNRTRYLARRRNYYAQVGKHRRHASPSQLAILRAGTDRWKAENREKVNASAKLYYAILTGKITRPKFCSHCGWKGRIYGHHEDYSKPYDVRWLCGSCHKLLHKGLLEK